ncbi:ThiJ/PfpI family protein [Klebsiella pneumoniae IS53]|nr:ThiJ/PfpI family protein [Klebsiella pneumoniae IS53]
MLVGDYAEDYETMVPFQALQMIGHQVDAVCPDKTAGDYVMTAIHDFDGAQTYSEKPGHRFTLNADFAAVKAENYDALVIPGGRRRSICACTRRLLKLVQAFDAARKPIAAVCHGPQLLAAAGILQGRTCSAYPACAPEVRLSGGHYADIGIDQAHVDGNLVYRPRLAGSSTVAGEIRRPAGGITILSRRFLLSHPLPCGNLCLSAVFSLG